MLLTFENLSRILWLNPASQPQNLRAEPQKLERVKGKVCSVYSFSGTNGPGNERSREQMFQRTNSLENESSRERMVPRMKVPSWEQMFQGTNSLENEYSSIPSKCMAENRRYVELLSKLFSHTKIHFFCNKAWCAVLYYNNSSGRAAIYRIPTRKLLAVYRIFIYDFVSLISVVTGNGNSLHFRRIFPVGKPTASYLLTPLKIILLSGPAYIVSGPCFAVIGLL